MRTEDEIAADLKAARAEVGRLEDELQSARLMKCPIAIGMTVQPKSGRRAGSKFLVTRLTPWSSGQASVYGAAFKKNGRPGERSIYIGLSEEMKVCKP